VSPTSRLCSATTASCPRLRKCQRSKVSDAVEASRDAAPRDLADDGTHKRASGERPRGEWMRAVHAELYDRQKGGVFMS
jgi:hypothetical protein